MIKFAGRNIFGSQQRQAGPMPTARILREQLPGVIGFRMYRLAGRGPDTLLWTVSGRLVGLTIGDLERQIADAQSYMNGTAYAFQTIGGSVIRNCQLVDYRPAPPFQRVQYNGIFYSTVMIQATIERASL